MKKLYIISAIVLSGTMAHAQSAIDAYRLSQPDLKGTARFMSMSGAFTALGGDLSTISQNPAGIGVYRSNEVGFTLDLDCQHSTGEEGGYKSDINQTKFLLNNIGFVWTLKLPSSSCPNINFGFTYNKTSSFNRRYVGSIGLNNQTQSLSNLIADVTTQGGYAEGQLIGDEYNNWDPYNPPASDVGAPWLSILGYQSFLTSLSPYGTNQYVGQWADGKTTGYGLFDVQEQGSVDSYNIALGGNISNIVFWGMDFDITHLNYTLTPNWTENLQDARVEGNNGFENIPANWTLRNYYNCNGTGFNYKLGIIVKPIQELRLGVAFHTPTWYGLTETFKGSVSYLYDNEVYGEKFTNNNMMAYNDVNFRTPWKLTVGAAAVLFNKLILSADYEWQKYSTMKYSVPGYGGGDYWGDDWNNYPWYDYSAEYKAKQYISYPYQDIFYETNEDIKNIYQSTNTLRLGAEYRVIPQMSVRIGYAHVSSPVKAEMNKMSVYTSGTIPNYRFDRDTNYLTCGLGFRIKSFYIDAAYVYKHMSSTYHAYSPFYNETGTFLESPMSNVNLYNSQVVVSAGFKF